MSCAERRRRLAVVVRSRGFFRLATGGACVVLAVAALAACGGTKTVTTTVSVTTVPNGGATNVSNSVAAGAHDFTQFACAQCHGEQGRGGVSPDVPALTTIGKQLTPVRLRSIIDHGLGESANP